MVSPRLLKIAGFHPPPTGRFCPPADMGCVLPLRAAESRRIRARASVGRLFSIGFELVAFRRQPCLFPVSLTGPWVVRPWRGGHAQLLRPPAAAGIGRGAT